MRNKRLIIIFSVLCGLTLLIIVNSILFSVQYVNAYCFNDEDAALDNSVLSASGISKGKSIFFLNEDEVIASVESGVPGKNVRVVNIEKKFPNQVYINYYKVLRYFKVVSGGKAYYLSNDCVVMSIEDDGGSDIESVITVRLKGEVTNTAAGSVLASTDASDAENLAVISEALSRVMMRGTAIGVIESINMSGAAQTTKNFIYFHTSTGVYWEMQNTVNAFEKLRTVWSVYRQKTDLQTSGTFIMSGREEVRVFHSESNRFSDGL